MDFLKRLLCGGPALAANTPREHREGTVGRLLPGVQHQLGSVPGVNEGGRLHVKGLNVMLGYLRPAELVLLFEGG